MESRTVASADSTASIGDTKAETSDFEKFSEALSLAWKVEATIVTTPFDDTDQYFYVLYEHAMGINIHKTSKYKFKKPLLRN